MKHLVKRWNARESKLGKFLVRWVSTFLLICSAIGGSMEYLSLIPSDWVPSYIQKAVPIAGLISLVAGKLTKAKDHGEDRQRGEDDDQST